MSDKKKIKKPRGFKIALAVIVFLFLLFAATLYFLPSFLPVDAIRSMVRTRAKALTGLDVNFKSLGFSWSGSAIVEGVTVTPFVAAGTDGGAETAAEGKPLLAIEQVRINVAVAPLLSGKIVVDSVVVNGFAVDVRRDADGRFNLPAFVDLPAVAQGDGSVFTRRGGRDVLLAAVAVSDQPAQGLPPIELHRLDFVRGTVSFSDAIAKRSLNLGVDSFRVEGGDLNEPFTLSGKVLPYPQKPEQGEFILSGRAALIQGGAFNPKGEASLEVDVRNFVLPEMAAGLGFGAMLPSGRVDGRMKLGYAEEKALLSLVDFRLRDVVAGAGDGLTLDVPESFAGLDAEFNPASGMLVFGGMSLRNELFVLDAKGWMEGVYALADGGMPVVALDYRGSADFAGMTAYLARQKLALPPLPEVGGQGEFSGKAVLGQRRTPEDPLAPSLTLDFGKGRLTLRKPAAGIAVDMELTGVGMRATASLGDAVAVHSDVSLTNVPVAATVDMLGREPIRLVLNGGLALAGSTAGEAAVELRLAGTQIRIPATPWAGALAINNSETRLTYDAVKDELRLSALRFDVNETVRGEIKSAVASGILAGNPTGVMDAEISAVLGQLREMFAPLAPPQIGELAGGLRAAARIKLDGGKAEALTQAEIDNVAVGVHDPAGAGRLSVPKVKMVLGAGFDMAVPQTINLTSFSLDAGGGEAIFEKVGGVAASGRVGEMMLRAAGSLDLAAMQAEFSSLVLGAGGMAVNIGRDGKQIAGLESGVMRVSAATPEKKLSLPLSVAGGDFALPAMEAGADNFVFYLLSAEGARESSDLGSVRATLALDGSFGQNKPQIIHLRTAAFSAKPLAVNSRGQVNVTDGTLAVEYAARLAPAGLTAILGFFNLPPALLSEAAVSGVLSWDGKQATTRGASQGRLRLSENETNPFEMVHDISAAYQEAEKTLIVNVRRLDGNVKTAGGEAVVTLAAQPSNLLLSRLDSKGLLDIRLQGAAAPTRLLLQGVVGLTPQLREYARLIADSRADGIYNAWLQVRDNGSGGLGLNMGGVWQGAALQVNNIPYLAESGKLSAAIEGDFSFRDKRARLSRLFLRSDSAYIQADGSAEANLSADAEGSINGVSTVNVDLRFVMADLSRAVRVFPGLISPELGLRGRMDGTFKAGGDARDIRVSEGQVRFQGFAAQLSGQTIAIPSGTADFNAVVALMLRPLSGPATPYDMVKMFDIRDGRASLTGASLNNRPVEALSGSFQLQNGLLTLGGGRLAVAGGGGALAEGTVDFNSAAPVANLRLALQNFPLAEINSDVADYMTFQSGVISLPATGQGQMVGIAFQGLDTKEILRTLRLDNFTFATGPVEINTGPILNAELDKARGLMRQEVKESGKVRVITLKSMSGSAVAVGDGIIRIPQDRPIVVVGDNTGDFQVSGSLSADYALNLDFYVMGKLENLIGFSLPNLIPNLRAGSDEERNRFMVKMNQNAAAGRYRVNISGTVEQPNLSGIGELAARFLVDIMTAVPGQILGGSLDLVKDAPGAVLRVPGAILTDPIGSVLNAPRNVGRGLGSVFGLNRGGGEEQEAAEQQPQQPAGPQQPLLNAPAP